MNGWLFAAGLLAAATAVVHVVAGGRSVVRPLLGGSLPAEPRRTLHAVWHLVTADLSLSSVVLLALAWASEPSTPLVLFIAAQYAAYAVVFLVVALTADWPRPLLRLPQWMLLLPVGVLAFLGTV
ncbi:hypothetical protein M4914_08550 [Streptomyces somaliensis DSM 40738]|uniref:Uncharacterized protein n=1 Tax=Streptomyces somaliensis (strain ATCC 33201 / DSM 40738 / JCM 12659 / KCTC 9044 / NCTC 11332 / NRRL B-12077 / IP 733) TaxID=1134445 RepID=A0AA44DE90_STRE0|nr:hypothetical protein [Streptomyces somaliensis]MCQ0022991.1 hypothetical protein [Streptomyces somaliensis DSM 40738]NKY15331.1 hypothetical protein [Streptomyces somaliensis DSM 40738]